MRNEGMTRGKKLAMLFFLAVAAAFMLSFARPQAAQAKVRKATAYVNKKNKKTITVKEGDQLYVNFKDKKGKKVQIKKKVSWMPKIKKPAWGLLTAANWWGKIKYSDRSIVQLRDGSFYAMKAGTTKVTVKYKNKKSVFKVNVKSDGVKVSMKTSFDMNAVSKDWVREQSVIDECDSFDATLNKFDGLVYDYDIEDWVYTKDKSKTKEIIGKLKYEDGKKRFYNTTLKPLTTATKANAAKLAKEQKRKYKVGNMINTVTLTVKNKSSHTVTLPRYADCLAGAYCAEKTFKPGEIGELGYLGRPCFEATSGKKTTVKPGGSATVKYVSHDEVLQAAEAYAIQSSWDGGAGYFDVQSANFFFRSSIVFPTKTSK